MSRAASSTSWSRRGALGALLGLGACGFRPLHGPVEDSTTGLSADLQKELAAVRVGPIGERFGQMLRRDLQRRLEANAPGTAARYTLTVGVGITGEVLGYRRDGTISRIRYTATGQWNLATQSVPPQIIANNPLPFRTIDSFNVPDLQFFAADTSREAMERRLVDALSEELVREVTLALRSHLEKGGTPVGSPPRTAAG